MHTTPHQIHVGRGQRTANISTTNFTRIPIPNGAQADGGRVPTDQRPADQHSREPGRVQTARRPVPRNRARTVSAGNGRTNPLAMAEIWDLLADRVERTPRPSK